MAGGRLPSRRRSLDRESLPSGAGPRIAPPPVAAPRCETASSPRPSARSAAVKGNDAPGPPRPAGAGPRPPTGPGILACFKAPGPGALRGGGRGSHRREAQWRLRAALCCRPASVEQPGTSGHRAGAERSVAARAGMANASPQLSRRDAHLRVARSHLPVELAPDLVVDELNGRRASPRRYSAKQVTRVRLRRWSRTRVSSLGTRTSIRKTQRRGHPRSSHKPGEHDERHDVREHQPDLRGWIEGRLD